MASSSKNTQAPPTTCPNSPKPPEPPPTTYQTQPPNASSANPSEIPPHPDNQNTISPPLNYARLFNFQRKISREFLLEKTEDTVIKKSELRDCGNCLVGYILGRFPGLKAVDELRAAWKIPHIFSTHASGWMIFEFETQADRMKVLNDGPYEIYGSPMLLKLMPKLFRYTEDDRATIPIWVKLPDLPLECWDKQPLSRIATQIGQPIAADPWTADRTRKSFARLLIEVDITKPLTRKIRIQIEGEEPFDQPVQYEKEPKYCTICKRIGHDEMGCRMKQMGGQNRAQSRPPKPINSNDAQQIGQTQWIPVNRRGRSHSRSKAKGKEKQVPQTVQENKEGPGQSSNQLNKQPSGIQLIEVEEPNQNLKNSGNGLKEDESRQDASRKETEQTETNKKQSTIDGNDSAIRITSIWIDGIENDSASQEGTTRITPIQIDGNEIDSGDQNIQAVRQGFDAANKEIGGVQQCVRQDIRESARQSGDSANTQGKGQMELLPTQNEAEQDGANNPNDLKGKGKKVGEGSEQQDESDQQSFYDDMFSTDEKKRQQGNKNKKKAKKHGRYKH
ncbi:MAG: hypothetical protein CPSOU_6784 [uncultured Paraburkholderia sp.]|nr:MAG: hypothetical protein CPSOU_6784 [uncultured Paraburkholderia sp.]